METSNSKQPKCSNLQIGDLKREERILRLLHRKMAEQVQRLEVEELELKQKIRRKDMQELQSPPLPVNLGNEDADKIELTLSKKGSQKKNTNNDCRKIELKKLTDGFDVEFQDFLSNMYGDSERPTLSSAGVGHSANGMRNGTQSDMDLATSDVESVNSQRPTLSLATFSQSPEKVRITRNRSVAGSGNSTNLAMTSPSKPQKLQLELDLSLLPSFSGPSSALPLSQQEFSDFVESEEEDADDSDKDELWIP